MMVLTIEEAECVETVRDLMGRNPAFAIELLEAIGLDLEAEHSGPWLQIGSDACAIARDAKSMLGSGEEE